MNRTVGDIQRIIETYGIPARDAYGLPASAQRFPDGAHYRNEISGVANLQQLRELVEEMQKRAVPVHRVIYSNASRQTLAELREAAKIAADHRLELITNPGPTAITDVGRHAETEFGKWGGWRVRGADHLTSIIVSIYRCVEAGIRGILFFDEGALWLAARMRRDGHLPRDLVFKMSYTAGHRNPGSARLLEELGADSFNPVTDLEVPMFASLRQCSRIIMDIVIYGWETLGNVSRLYQAPDIVRVSAPCYLKQELTEDSRTKVKYCEIIWEMMQATYPEITVSGQGPADLSVPVV